MREILGLIPKEYRRGCLRVAMMVPVQAILNLVGVAALIPVMLLVLDSSKLQASFLGKAAAWLNVSLGDDFSAFVVIAVIAVLLLKTGLSLLITNYNNRFLLSLYRNLSSQLFVALYSRGLLYVKNHNSARLAFNVTGVCHNFVMGYLGGWMGLFGEIAFIVILFAALLLYSAKATLMAVCAFLPVMVLYLLAVRKPLKDISKKENEARREQNRLLYETFRGYSEVQVNNAFPIIRQRFTQGLSEISSFRIRMRLIQSIPSYLLELSVVVIVAVMLIFSVNASSPDHILFLGVFAVALMKLLPAARSIIGAISALNATEYTKEVIADIKAPAMFNALHDNDVPPIPFEQGITVRNVSFQFEDDENPVFENLDFFIRKGMRFGIQGRTGAGKTTLFNILLGLYPPTKGEILIDGVPLTMDNLSSWHKIVGYVPQDVFVSDSTILENVALGINPADIDREKAMTVLDQASLGDFVRGLPSGLDTKIGEAGCKMSGGQRQRLGIARALYKDASVLFFDEATSALDSQTEREVNEAIRDLSGRHSELTIIVISHRDTTMSFCDETFQM